MMIYYVSSDTESGGIGVYLEGTLIGRYFGNELPALSMPSVIDGRARTGVSRIRAGCDRGRKSLSLQFF